MRKLRLDGKLNYHKGLSFSFSRNNHVISFLIDTIDDRKKKLRVTMHPDINHDRPHVHIGQHDASIAIDTGELLAGDCDNRTLATVQSWIARHRGALLELWEIVKGGGRYEQAVERIRRDLNYRDFGFRGEEPEMMTEIHGVKIWHTGEIVVDREGNIIIVVCDGDMFVGLPSDFTEGSMKFEAVDGKIIVKRA